MAVNLRPSAWERKVTIPGQTVPNLGARLMPRVNTPKPAPVARPAPSLQPKANFGNDPVDTKVKAPLFYEKPPTKKPIMFRPNVRPGTARIPLNRPKSANAPKSMRPPGKMGISAKPKSFRRRDQDEEEDDDDEAPVPTPKSKPPTPFPTIDTTPQTSLDRTPKNANYAKLANQSRLFDGRLPPKYQVGIDISESEGSDQGDGSDDFDEGSEDEGSDQGDDGSEGEDDDDGEEGSDDGEEGSDDGEDGDDDEEDEDDDGVSFSDEGSVTGGPSRREPSDNSKPMYYRPSSRTAKADPFRNPARQVERPRVPMSKQEKIKKLTYLYTHGKSVDMDDEVSRLDEDADDVAIDNALQKCDSRLAESGTVGLGLTVLGIASSFAESIGVGVNQHLAERGSKFQVPDLTGFSQYMGQEEIQAAFVPPLKDVHHKYGGPVANINPFFMLALTFVNVMYKYGMGRKQAEASGHDEASHQQQMMMMAQMQQQQAMNQMQQQQAAMAQMQQQQAAMAQMQRQQAAMGQPPAMRPQAQPSTNGMSASQRLLMRMKQQTQTEQQPAQSNLPMNRVNQDLVIDPPNNPDIDRIVAHLRALPQHEQRMIAEDIIGRRAAPRQPVTTQPARQVRMNPTVSSVEYDPASYASTPASEVDYDDDSELAPDTPALPKRSMFTPIRTPGNRTQTKAF
jgi:hypothetical protein